MAKRRQGEDEALRRRRASREIGQAYRTVTAIRALYFCTAGLAGVFLLAVLPGGDARWIGVFAAATAMLAIGGFRVMKQPGEWSVGIALVITALNVVLLADGPVTLTNIWGVAISLCLWAVVPLAFRVRRLLAKHGDLYIAEKWHGTRAAPRETERSRRIARETERQKQTKQLTMLVLIGAFVVFVAALTILPRLTGPDEDEIPVAEEAPRPEFGSRALRFRAAWNDGAWDAVAEFLAPRDRPRRSAKLQRILERRGWEPRPRLGLPAVEEDRYGRMIATYPLADQPDVVLEIRWEAGETDWWWTGSKWPPRDD